MKITLTPLDPPKRRWAQSGGKPDPKKLRAALEAIENAVEPDIVILYGSAARSAMKANSDVDLMLVKNEIDYAAADAAVQAGTSASGGRTHVQNGARDTRSTTQGTRTQPPGRDRSHAEARALNGVRPTGWRSADPKGPRTATKTRESGRPTQTRISWNSDHPGHSHPTGRQRPLTPTLPP